MIVDGRTFPSPLRRVVLVSLVVLMLSACGKKTPPKPIAEVPPPVVEGFTAEVSGGRVLLEWSVTRQRGDKAAGADERLIIQRSLVQWKDRQCRECPPLALHQVADLNPKSPAPAVLEDGRYRWADRNVALGEVYRYQIALVERGGRALSISSPLHVWMMEPPPAPTALSAVAELRGIMLQWKDPEGIEPALAQGATIAYRVERWDPEKEWVPLSRTPVRGNGYLDAQVDVGAMHKYRVTSLYEAGDALVYGNSAEIEVIAAPEAVAPPPPETVWIIPHGGSLEVYWSESVQGVGGYHVYRKQGREITRLTAQPVAGPPFVDAAVEKNEVYLYAVSCVSSGASQREGLLSKWVEIRNVSFD